MLKKISLNPVKFSLPLLVIGFISLSACDGSNSSESKSITLNWSAPTEFSDNTPLSESEIFGYRIYYGTDENALTNNFVIETNGSADSFTLDYDTYNIADNTVYYVAMSTITTSGIESNLSEVISFNSM